MILYLSSVIDDDAFAALVTDGKVTGGHQAQKFNSLVARGLSTITNVIAISNPPYAETEERILSNYVFCDSIKYVSISNNNSRLHKLQNYVEMSNYIKREAKGEIPEAIVCDAINPLASLNAIRYARKWHIPAVAIVTDVPEYMDRGRESIFTRLTSYLLKKYDAYVLLTEGMNQAVNANGKPYIIMEGLCESHDDMPALVVNDNAVFTCLYTGSLSRGTGIEELVHAVRQINDIKIELKIYGNGELAEWLEALTKEDERIKYGGVITNAEAVEEQKKADLLINPRPTDIAYGNMSFPSKIMEYMASGTALLTTGLPGIPREYFEYFYLIDDYTANGIAEAIRSVYSLPASERELKAAMAREFVVKNKNNRVQAIRIMNLIGAL